MRARVLFVLLFTATTAAAQQMPDPSQMAGLPLPAPELDTGTVSVRVVRERMGNNVTNQRVSLRTADRTLDASTDTQGRATFADVPPGTVVTVETIVDGETLRSQEFSLPPSGGVRVALIAGLAEAARREQAERQAAANEPARRGVVVFGGESRVILEFQDDNLQVFYLLDVVNNARTPIDIGEPMYLMLPDGAAGAGTLQGSSSLAVVQGDRVRFNGPFPPGVTQVQIGYRYPYAGSTATIVQQWPAAFEQLFVAAEKVGALQMSSPQFQQQQEANAGGAPFLMATGGRIDAGNALTLTLSGLPHRSQTLRNVGIAAGVLILAAGLWIAISPGRTARTGDEDLLRRKEKLLNELVTLEAQHRDGRGDPRRYGARRQSLVAQLERVMGELDHGDVPGPRRGGSDDGQGVAA